MKEKVFNFIKETFGAQPEYLWEDSPDTAAIRNKRNKKWFAAYIGNLKKSKLGLNGEGTVDILNLKCDPLFQYTLVDNIGIFKAYHMNKTHWISVLLDGTVEMERLKFLICESYSLIDKKGKKVGK